MRTKHYNLKGFRLSEEVINNLNKIREEKNLSWNLLFSDMIKKYELPKMQSRNGAKKA